MGFTRLWSEPDDGVGVRLAKGIPLWNECKDLEVNLG